MPSTAPPRWPPARSPADARFAIAVATIAAVAAYIPYAVGLPVSVEPWQPLSPFHQALTGGPLGAEPRPVGVVPRVLAQLRDPMIMLLGAAALTAVLRDLTDLAVILAVIVLNATVGVVQELRAERALSALRRLAAPQARVVRSGETLVVPAAEIVPGDLVLLQAGDIVPADAEITGATRLQADESALTGESVPVEKDPGDELFAGTVITRGGAPAW